MAYADTDVSVAVVLVACDAGAGTPPRTILVYDQAYSRVGVHLLQTLHEDGLTQVTDEVGAEGLDVTARGLADPAHRSRWP